MASTNHTTYFDLSQYTANDKPTYLVDYNGDMNKIDAGLHEADSDAKTAISEIGDLTNLTTSAKNTIVASINEVDAEADQNTSAIGNLSNLTTTATSDLVSAINEVDGEADNNTSHIGVMANLETAVKTNLVGAVNEVNDKINNFKLTVFTTPTATAQDSGSGNPSLDTANITVAKNSDGSVFKIYGDFLFSNSAWSTSNKIVLSNTGLPTVDTEYTINGAGYTMMTGDPSYIVGKGLSITYKTNGNIEIDLGGLGYNSFFRGYLSANLYFNENFGDTPTPE